MMKERYRNMMEQAALSEKAKADLLEKLEQKRPARKGARVLRAALIAACACVVLIGGAFAAEYISGAGILEFFTGKIVPGQKTPQDGYTVSFPALKQFATDELSEELRNWLAISRSEREITREFEEWDDAEAFLGIELTNNPILDELNKAFVMNNQHCWGAFFDGNGQLERAEITAYYNYKLEEGCDLIIVAGVVTEHQKDYDDNFWSLYWKADESELEVVGNYVTPSGLSASILKTPVGHEAFFSASGVAFSLTILNEPVETLYQILDAFEF